MPNLIIMAGGSGTRFWPESRRARPKQFLTLTGGRSLLQQAVDRCQSWISASQMRVVTNVAHVEETLRQLPCLGRQQVIAEPQGRNTAPCIGLAARQIWEEDQEAILLVTPADHLIRPESEFRATIETAVSLVNQRPEASLLIGIPPTYPATGYGYIERGSQLADRESVWEVQQFREKPDEATAKLFVESGQFFWNSGIFVWRARRVLELIENFQPQIHSGIEQISRSAQKVGWEAAVKEQFASLPSISIDHGVLEPLVAAGQSPGAVLVVPATFEWDDVGSWQALPKALGTDTEGNTVAGVTCLIETENCVIRSTGEHLIATIGLKDLVVVHTGDATLIAPAGDENALRKLVARIEEQGLGRYL